MKSTFEGHLPAQSEAENQAKKLKKETWVVKDNSSGIHYHAVDSIEDLPEGCRVLDHYNDKGVRV